MTGGEGIVSTLENLAEFHVPAVVSSGSAVLAGCNVSLAKGCAF